MGTEVKCPDIDSNLKSLHTQSLSIFIFHFPFSRYKPKIVTDQSNMIQQVGAVVLEFGQFLSKGFNFFMSLIL